MLLPFCNCRIVRVSRLLPGSVCSDDSLWLCLLVLGRLPLLARPGLLPSCCVCTPNQRIASILVEAEETSPSPLPSFPSSSSSSSLPPRLIQTPSYYQPPRQDTDNTLTPRYIPSSISLLLITLFSSLLDLGHRHRYHSGSCSSRRALPGWSASATS
jgi:hypothetical protein